MSSEKHIIDNINASLFHFRHWLGTKLTTYSIVLYCIATSRMLVRECDSDCDIQRQQGL